MVSAQQVQALILSRFQNSILEAGFDPAKVGDDFDLLTSGVTDSIGIVDLLASIEQFVGLPLDFSDMDPEDLTVIGRLARHVEKQLTALLHDQVSSKATP
jgi:acyl carrier protein